MKIKYKLLSNFWVISFCVVMGMHPMSAQENVLFTRVATWVMLIDITFFNPVIVNLHQVTKTLDRECCYKVLSKAKYVMKLPYFSHNFEMNHEAKVLVGISQMLLLQLYDTWGLVTTDLRMRSLVVVQFLSSNGILINVPLCNLKGY